MQFVKKIKIDRVLIIVDPQICFMEGGTLPVKNGKSIVPFINALMVTGEYDLIIVTQDWHPVGHYSFASRHGKELFSQIERAGHVQILYTDHGIAGTDDAMINPDLNMAKVAYIIRKGMDIDVDSHSAFFSAPDAKGNRITTGLPELLEAYEIEGIDFVGLAFDVCVKLSALDAAEELGYECRVLKEYTASVFPKNDEKVIAELEVAGCEVVR